MIGQGRHYLVGAGLGPILVRAVAGGGALHIAGMAFGFLVGIQLARGLGPAGYGIYGLVMSFVSILSVPVEFGVPSLVTREVAAYSAASNWGMVRGILEWSQKTVLLAFAALLAVVALGWVVTEGGASNNLLLPGALGLVSIPIVASGNLRAAALRGLQHLVQGNVPDILVRPALFALLLAIFFMAKIEPLSPVVAIGLQTIAAVGSFALGHYLLKRALPTIILSVPAVTTPRAWIGTAWPMAMSEGMRIVQGQVAILFLGLMVPIDEVGLFRVASSMLLLLGMPVTLFNVLAAPVAARLYAEKDYGRLQRLLTWSAVGMTGMVGLLSLPFLVAGRPLISLVFGAEFQDAALPLAILALGCCVNAYFGVGLVVLNMTGHHSHVTRIFGVTLVFLCVCTPLFIAAFGMIGAAMATAISLGLFSALAGRRVGLLLGLKTSLMGLRTISRR